MLIGIHTSTAGALDLAVGRAKEAGANCLQIFSASPRMWSAPPIKMEAATALQRAQEEAGMRPLVIHANYLINLCGNDAGNLEKSQAAFRGEVERAIALQASYLVFHPGSGKGEPAEAAIARFGGALPEALRGLQSQRLTILIENTAGQGAVLGSQLPELRALREAVQNRVEFAIGFCLDTCHAYAAGYDVSSSEGVSAFVSAAEAELGLERVPVFHVNDSKGGLGSHLDRHEHIGQGLIGEEGFASLLQHPKLQDKAFVLETPWDEDDDAVRNVAALWRLSKPGAVAAKAKVNRVVEEAAGVAAKKRAVKKAKS